MAVVITVVVIGAIVGVALANAATSPDPDTALSAQFGGASRANYARQKDFPWLPYAPAPRNFRLWSVYPDGRVRFQSAYFPPVVDAPASEVVTIAGPLVNQPSDILSVTYFGALNISGAIQAGPGGDANRSYELFSLERDPASESYGVNVLITNPPYLSVDTTDPTYRSMAMGAPPQDYYEQMVWALALPPGSQISSAAHQEGSDTASTMLRPYRRMTVGGWTIYYFDVSNLVDLQIIRIRFLPPTAGGAELADPDFWLADRLR